MLSGQRNTTPNTGGVFAVGATKQTMDVTDVQRLGGTPLGMVGACSGPSGASPVAPGAPDRCPRTVPPSTGRGVVLWPERVLLFDSFITVVPMGNSQVKGRLHGEGL